MTISDDWKDRDSSLSLYCSSREALTFCLNQKVSKKSSQPDPCFRFVRAYVARLTAG